MGTITDQMQGSAALQLIISQGWNWKNGTAPNVELETCPYCKHSGFGHFYIETHGIDDPKKSRDGLHMCQRCGKSGNLYALRTLLGIANSQFGSTKEAATGYAKIDRLPDVDACHEHLMQDGAALEYLTIKRGLSLDIIQKMKIGLVEKQYFKNQGEIRALVFPYLVNGNCIFAHYRSLPDLDNPDKVQKAFASPKGWDATLYNGEILREGLKEVIFVEGEMDTLIGLDHGIANLCGVPGANIKKAEWLDTLDRLGIERIYIMYDDDKVGQKAAQVLASRIGLDRCWKIVLPSFKIDDGDLGSRFGKDLNEWFLYGNGSLEAFEQLKLDAKQFDVDGVSDAGSALDEFEDELDEKGSGQKYVTPWPSLSRILRFDTGDVIDILAPEKIGKTTFGMNLIEFMVDTYGEDGVIICLEMTRARLARKWLCHKTLIADTLATSKEEEEALTARFKAEIPHIKDIAANRDGNLYFCYPSFTTTDDIYALMAECIRRYGVKWIMFDNLQLLCDLTLNGRNRTEHLSGISKRLTKIAKDNRIQMIRILQPHRIGEGKVATSNSVDGASQIPKDCDCIIVLNRASLHEVNKDILNEGGYIQTEGTFSPEMHVAVPLSRYSVGGSTTLYIIGATSTVCEVAEAQIAAMNAKLKENTKNGSWKNALATLTTFTNPPTEPLPIVQGEITP